MTNDIIKAEALARKNADLFASVIKLRQKELGLSTTEISARSGLPYDKVQAFKDKKASPTFEEFSRVCQAIEVEPVINFWRYSELDEKHNTNTEVQITLSHGAKMPEKAYNGDAAYDLFALSDTTIPAGGSVLVPTGVKIAFPGYLVAKVWARSGMSVKHNIEVGAGVIDSNYRGDVGVHLYNHGSSDYSIKAGERIAQLCFIHKANVSFKLCDNLPKSDRDEKGFGSSGA